MNSSIKAILIGFSLFRLTGNELIAQNLVKDTLLRFHDSINNFSYRIEMYPNGLLKHYSVSNLNEDTLKRGYFTFANCIDLSTGDMSMMGIDDSIPLSANTWYPNGNPHVQIGRVSYSPYTIKFIVYYPDYSIEKEGYFSRVQKDKTICWVKVKTWKYYDLRGKLIKTETNRSDNLINLKKVIH